MTTVASRLLTVVDSTRGEFSVRLVIGQPYRVAENEWACPVALEGLYEHLWDQHGLDSFQALMVAQNLARTLLNDFIEQGGRLLEGPGGLSLDVERLFTVGAT
ncbi:MAG: hypothetical protein ABI859_17105 [Pseudomonadota bacterium]